MACLPCLHKTAYEMKRKKKKKKRRRKRRRKRWKAEGKKIAKIDGVLQVFR